MMLIDCPFCGLRELHEFHFHRLLPPPDAALDADGFAAVYERDNNVNHSVEYWQHRHGCQAWLLIERNPSTTEVISVRMLRGDQR